MRRLMTGVFCSFLLSSPAEQTVSAAEMEVQDLMTALQIAGWCWQVEGGSETLEVTLKAHIVDRNGKWQSEVVTNFSKEGVSPEGEKVSVMITEKELVMKLGKASTRAQNSLKKYRLARPFFHSVGGMGTPHEDGFIILSQSKDRKTFTGKVEEMDFYLSVEIKAE